MDTLPYAPRISQVQPEETSEVVAFVRQARARMFPLLDPDFIPDDLKRFSNVYLSGNSSGFFIARSEGRLIGAIGYLPYDGRFPQLDYTGRKTVEVVRLFLDPEFRRIGLGARMFQALKTAARKQGVEVFYLHTHPFLAGAIEFWQRQGFAIVDVEDDPVWRTTHMQLTP
jgi:GNAT superfamily N-acetyltransferase